MGATSALVGYSNATTELEKQSQEATERINQMTSEYEKLTEEVNKNATSQLAEVANTEKLVKELDSLVNSNGKVKKGYEGRVSFILGELNEAYGTEYKIVDGIVEKYSDLKEKIKDLISTKKAEIVLNAYEEKYTEALKNRGQAYQDLETKEKSYLETKKKSDAQIAELEKMRAEAQKIHNDNLVRSIDLQIETSKKIVEEKENEYNSVKKILDNYNKDIYNYETLQTATMSENKELQAKIVEEFTNTVEVNGEKITLSGEQQLGLLRVQAEEYIKIIQDKGDKVTEEEKNQLNGVLTLLQDKLLEQTKIIENLTPDNINAWKKLAEGSKEKFNEAIKSLPEDVQKKLNEIIYGVDATSPQVEKSLEKSGSESGKKWRTEFNSNGKLSISDLIGTKTDWANKGLSASNAFWSNWKTGKVSVTTTDDGGAKLTVRGTGKYQGYATGGFPSVGEMFIAREAGPELVGKIGNTTSVMNNQQIVQAVSQGVAQAVASVMGNRSGGDIRLIVDGRELTTVVEEGIMRRQNIYGTA